MRVVTIDLDLLLMRYGVDLLTASRGREADMLRDLEMGEVSVHEWTQRWLVRDMAAHGPKDEST